jgi:hypothetical protein
LQQERSIKEAYYNKRKGKAIPITSAKAKRGCRVTALPSINLGAR